VLTLSTDATHPDPEAIARAAALVREGRVVAFPTDTLYGLAADPGQAEAVEELYRIKGRQVDQAIPLIAADLDQVRTLLGELPEAVCRLGACFWPGPLTLILPAWPGLAPNLLAGGTTVAVRVPDHPVARALARAAGGPITSTSANRSGAPPTSDPAAVAADLGPSLAGLLDAGPSPGGPASTIVDVRGHEPRLLRPGAVAFERVLECLR